MATALAFSGRRVWRAHQPRDECCIRELFGSFGAKPSAARTIFHGTHDETDCNSASTDQNSFNMAVLTGIAGRLPHIVELHLHFRRCARRRPFALGPPRASSAESHWSCTVLRPNNNCP